MSIYKNKRTRILIFGSSQTCVEACGMFTRKGKDEVMGNRRYHLLGERQCEGCGNVFQPQRRDQVYHSQACKQTAYYRRTKRKNNVLRNALVLPILSLFPGIGLLDRAFEEQGLTVVRGPDLLWGDDIRDFHPQPGHFGGIIGGPLCQAWSRLRYLVEHNGLKVAADLIPEYERCVQEAQPAWFLMENVQDAPIPRVPGNQVHAQLLNNRTHGGGTQNRTRRISFGTRDGRCLVIPEVEVPTCWAPAVCASGGVKPGVDRSRTPKANELGYKTRAAFEEIRRLQGLPDDFELPSLTVAGAIKAVGNGVLLPLGRAIAKAVRVAMSTHVYDESSFVGRLNEPSPNRGEADAERASDS